MTITILHLNLAINNNNCYNDKLTLQEMKDAIADTNNSAPGKDRLSYNMYKHSFQSFSRLRTTFILSERYIYKKSILY